ncbi:MAG TPA: hypothetical protein H9711_11480, partial [Candidatus Mediterraneibacter intestinavium]|nr:hypothetical protein [Candidatus Mediterraneibacter intestinavium]
GNRSADKYPEAIWDFPREPCGIFREGHAEGGQKRKHTGQKRGWLSSRGKYGILNLVGTDLLGRRQNEWQSGPAGRKEKRATEQTGEK